MQLPSHTTVAAYAALVLAAGGGATAGAAALSRNSVGTAQVRDRSIQKRDLAKTARPPSRARIAQVAVDATLSSDQVLAALSGAVKGQAGAAGPAGPQGDRGPQGTSGIAEVTRRDALSGDIATDQQGGATARCEPGERVLGGGGRFEPQGQGGAAPLTSSTPLDGEEGWTVTVSNAGATGRVHTWAICARLG